EEEGDAVGVALVTQRAGMVEIEGPVVRTGLAAADHPVGEVDRRVEDYRPKQRLARQEPDRSGKFSEERDPLVGAALILHGGPDPHVVGPETLLHPTGGD